jgi:segregation and condensation protein B
MTSASNSSSVLEALLLATDRPLSAARVASVMPRTEEKQIAGLVEELNTRYEETGRSFRIRQVAGGYRLFNQPEFESYVDALAVTSREARLSQAALETLAVVAYRQPVSKNDVEYVRGCDCDGVLRTLLTRRLVAIKGRSEAPGRPLLYATTDRFLEYFGLANMSDLPDWSEIAALVGESVPQTRLTLMRSAETAAETVATRLAPSDEADLSQESIAVTADAAETDPVEPAFAETASAEEGDSELVVIVPLKDAT